MTPAEVTWCLNVIISRLSRTLIKGRLADVNRVNWGPVLLSFNGRDFKKLMKTKYRENYLIKVSH